LVIPLLRSICDDYINTIGGHAYNPDCKEPEFVFKNFAENESNSKILRLRAARAPKTPFLIKDNSKTLRLRGQCNSKIWHLRTAKNQGNLKFFYKY
jgi:hypothetical protein